MTPATQALLVASDHSTACETPPGFDREREIERVRTLLPRLQQLAGLELTLDHAIEDASFFCDLACYREIRPRVRHPVLLIRFSAFGHLVTITSEDIDPIVIASLITALQDAGHHYVPADDLAEPYTGPNPALRDTTWWIRFFDYL